MTFVTIVVNTIKYKEECHILNLLLLFQLKIINSSRINLSQLGNLYDDIRCMASSLRCVEIKSIRRSANGFAHSLARYARHIDEDIVWLEDSPPPALEALYVDSLSISN